MARGEEEERGPLTPDELKRLQDQVRGFSSLPGGAQPVTSSLSWPHTHTHTLTHTLTLTHTHTQIPSCSYCLPARLRPSAKIRLPMPP